MLPLFLYHLINIVNYHDGMLGAGSAGFGLRGFLCFGFHLFRKLNGLAEFFMRNTAGA